MARRVLGPFYGRGHGFMQTTSLAAHWVVSSTGRIASQLAPTGTIASLHRRKSPSGLCRQSVSRWKRSMQVAHLVTTTLTQLAVCLGADDVAAVHVQRQRNDVRQGGRDRGRRGPSKASSATGHRVTSRECVIITATDDAALNVRSRYPSPWGTIIQVSLTAAVPGGSTRTPPPNILLPRRAVWRYMSNTSLITRSPLPTWRWRSRLSPGWGTSSSSTGRGSR